MSSQPTWNPNDAPPPDPRERYPLREVKKVRDETTSYQRPRDNRSRQAGFYVYVLDCGHEQRVKPKVHRGRGGAKVRCVVCPPISFP